MQLRGVRFTVALTMLACALTADDGGLARNAGPPGLVAVLNGSATPETLYESQFCAGAAVAPKKVLTVAHCVAERGADRLAIAFGGTDLCHPGAMEVTPVTEIRLVAGRPDLVELVLEGTVPGPLSVLGHSFDGEQLSAFGWGRLTQFGMPPCTVKAIRLESVPVDNCRSHRMRPTEVSGPTFCAQPSSGSALNTCTGDSGGPVYAGDGAVVGFVLGGVGCGSQDDGLYALVP